MLSVLQHLCTDDPLMASARAPIFYEARRGPAAAARAHTRTRTQVYCADMIPAPLSKIAFAANAALGRHQIEFVYDDYTLKAARMPSDEVGAE
jgi:hypothetical protein